MGTNFYNGKGGMGEFKQQTGVLGVSSGDFSMMYENDGKPFSNWSGDGNDSYRTAAVTIAVGDFSMGLNMFTGKRTKKEYEAEKTMEGGKLGHSSTGKFGEYYKNGLVKEEGTKYRMGALYLGYQSYRVGANSEWIRHFFQNQMIHGSFIANQRMFEMTDNKVVSFPKSWSWFCIWCCK